MSQIVEYYRLESILNESIGVNDTLSLDVLLEMLSLKLDMGDNMPMPLTENVNTINIFGEYLPLIEAVDEISSAKKDINELKNADDKSKDNVIKKCVRSIKKLLDWWYKVEPDKKFKTLHIILKILVTVLMFVLDIYLTKKISGRLLKTNLVTKLPDKIIHAKKGKDISVRNRMISTLIVLGLGQITEFIKKITSKKLEYKINEKDLNKNISEFDKSIDKINDQLDKIDDPELKAQLIRERQNLTNALAKLIKIRDDNKNKTK